MRRYPLSALVPAAALALLATALPDNAAAQRIHVDGLIGEPPDVSNWPHPAAPDGNPFPRSSASPSDLARRDAKVKLGKLLFWDEQVSIDNTMACGTCHIPASGGTDPRDGLAPNGARGSMGVIPQAMNPATGRVDYGFTNPSSPQIDRLVTGFFTPTMIGAYVFNRQFWDRRAGPDFDDGTGTMTPVPNFEDWAALEDQAVGPPVNDIEMGHQNMVWPTVEAKLNNSFPLALVKPGTIPKDIKPLVDKCVPYRKLFDEVFFSDPQFGGNQGVTRERFAMAIAHYERTLIPDKAPIDLGEMDDSQVRGFEIVRDSGCFFCHSTSNNVVLTQPGGVVADEFDNPFSDGQPHIIGINGNVKTPTLRNVGLRKRFFSDGLSAGGPDTLEGIITFYDEVQGGILGLDGSGPGGTLTDQEFKDVFSFLNDALTDPRVANEEFPFDKPELASERPEFEFESNEFGNGTAGPSGLVPEIIANAPPLVAKPNVSTVQTSWFKVGVGEALGGATALLLVSDHPGYGPILWVGNNFHVAVSTTTNADGIATAHTPFPLTTSTVGHTFYTQWAIDEGYGTAYSNAAKFTPFRFKCPKNKPIDIQPQMAP